MVALIKYSNGAYSYILAPCNLDIGNIVYSSWRPPKTSFPNLFMIGCNMIFRYSTYTSIFFNVEVNLKKGGQYARAAGTFCKVISLNLVKNTARIQLPTGVDKRISIYCTATIGQASNRLHYKEFYTTAGFFRNLGWRPSVRGVAMNPVDHPHGGRTKTSSPELTPWGKIAKHNR